MSIDLSMVQNDDYFSTRQAMTKAFTYATAVRAKHHATTDSNATATQTDDEEHKEIISDITGTRTESVIHKQRLEIEHLLDKQKEERAQAEAIMTAQKAEIQRLTEAYQRANIAYEEITTELRLQRTHVTTIIAEKLSVADKIRNEEMKAMRLEMMTAMKEMIQNTQHNDRQRASNHMINSNSKRTHTLDDRTDNNDTSDNRQEEKRVNRRQTPTKKLIFDEEHLAEEFLTQHHKQQGDDASSISE